MPTIPCLHVINVFLRLRSVSVNSSGRKHQSCTRSTPLPWYLSATLILACHPPGFLDRLVQPQPRTNRRSNAGRDCEPNSGCCRQIPRLARNQRLVRTKSTRHTFILLARSVGRILGLGGGFIVLRRERENNVRIGRLMR